jgi:hypothetical protein
VTVHYPFHPHCGKELKVIRKTRLGDGSLVVLDPWGMPLKTPVWMVRPEAKLCELTAAPEISARALLELAELLGAYSPSSPCGSLSEAGACPGKRGAGEAAGVRVRPGTRPPKRSQARPQG